MLDGLLKAFFVFAVWRKIRWFSERCTIVLILWGNAFQNFVLALYKASRPRHQTLSPLSRIPETAETLENCHGHYQPATLKNDTIFLECATLIDCAESLEFVEGCDEISYVWNVFEHVRYGSEA